MNWIFEAYSNVYSAAMMQDQSRPSSCCNCEEDLGAEALHAVQALRSRLIPTSSTILSGPDLSAWGRCYYGNLHHKPRVGEACHHQEGRRCLVTLEHLIPDLAIKPDLGAVGDEDTSVDDIAMVHAGGLEDGQDIGPGEPMLLLRVFGDLTAGSAPTCPATNRVRGRARPRSPGHSSKRASERRRSRFP